MSQDPPVVDGDIIDALLAEERCYAVIDPVVHADVAGFSQELVKQQRGAPIVNITQSEFLSEDTVPYVLQVNARFLRFIRRELLKEKEAARWGFFFALTDPETQLSTLVRHWRYWYQVQLPLGPENFSTTAKATPGAQKNVKTVFRFFDPRLLDAFLAVSSDREKSDFFGPLKALYLPQKGDKLERFTVPNGVTDPSHHAERKIFTMRPEHLRALELRRLEQRLPAFLEYLNKHFEPEWVSRDIHDRSRHVLKGLKRATAHGFFSERAAAGWLALELLHGEQFSTEQPWAREILGDKARVVGTDDYTDRLVKAGFDQIRAQEGQA